MKDDTPQLDPVAERARALAAQNAKKLREALAENAKLKAQIEELEEQLSEFIMEE